MLAMNSGKGRIFATMIGLPDGGENQALHCTGSIVTLQRVPNGQTTGAVTQIVPVISRLLLQLFCDLISRQSLPKMHSK